MLCPLIFGSNTIELTVYDSCYRVLDLLCVTANGMQRSLSIVKIQSKGCTKTDIYVSSENIFHENHSSICSIEQKPTKPKSI